MTGEKINKVFSFNDTKTFQYEVEDSSAILAQLEGGANVSIHSNFNIPDETANWRIEFYGTRGRILANETIGQVEGGITEVMITDNLHEYDAAQNKTLCNKRILDVECGNLYTKQIESFSNSVIHQTELECPADDAVYVQKVVEAAYLSSNTGSIVHVQSI